MVPSKVCTYCARVDDIVYFDLLTDYVDEAWSGSRCYPYVSLAWMKLLFPIDHQHCTRGLHN